MKTYKAVVSATVELTVTIKENINGDTEIVEVDGVIEISEYENIRPLN